MTLRILPGMVIASLFAVLVLLWPPAATAQDTGWIDQEPCTTTTTVLRRELNRYILELTETDRTCGEPSVRFVILGGNFRHEDRWLEVDESTFGQDLTGSGKPNIVINGESGGNQCCSTLIILEIADPPRELFRRESDRHTSGSRILRVGSGFAVETTDQWMGLCGACDSHPRVVLRFNGSRFAAAADLMRGPRPDQADLVQRAESVRDSYSDTYSNPFEDDLSREILALVYTGNLATACEFAALAWPADRFINRSRTSRQEYLVDLFRDIKAFGSTDERGLPGLWQTIAELNDVPPDGTLTCPLAP